MKVFHFRKRWWLAVALLGQLLNGCATTSSSSDQQQEAEANQGDGNAEQQGENAQAAGDQSQSDNGNASGNLQQGDEANLSDGGAASVNSDTGANEFAANNASGTLNNGGNNFLANNGGTEGVAVNNATEPDALGANTGNTGVTNTPVTDPAVNAVVDQSSAPVEAIPANAAPAAPATPAMAPAEGGIVKYVRPGGTQMYQDPQGQNVVKQLEQGDHPLVYENGEWARTSDGYYIPSKGLTSSPVGRAKRTAEWK